MNPRPGREESDEGHGAGPQGGVSIIHFLVLCVFSLAPPAAMWPLPPTDSLQALPIVKCVLVFPAQILLGLASGLPGTGMVSGFPRLSSPAPLPGWHG